MTDSERIMLNGLIDFRLEIACKGLDENAEYQEQCRRQEKAARPPENVFSVRRRACEAYTETAFLMESVPLRKSSTPYHYRKDGKHGFFESLKSGTRSATCSGFFL